MFDRIFQHDRRPRSRIGRPRIRRARRIPRLDAGGWDSAGAFRLEDRTLLATLSVALNPSAVAQNAGPGASTGTVARVGTGVDLSQPLTVTLSSADTTLATVPATVVIPANAASATFPVSPVANSITNGPRTVAISASGPVYSGLAADNTFGNQGQLGPSGIPTAMAVGPNGKVVVVGDYYTSNYDFGVQRYNADGTPDTTFGNNGTVITDLTGQNDQPGALAIQSDGKVVVGGVWIDASGADHFALVRYNTNGTLDTTFGSGGKVLNVVDSSYYSAIRALAIQSDGKIVAGGDIGSSLAVVRYNSNGTPDPAFGSNGVATVGLGQSSDRGFGIAIQADGKIVIAGQADGGNTIAKIELARFTAVGGLDATFGSGGTVLTDLPGGYDGAFGVALQPDGKIVVAGQESKDPNSFSTLDAVLIRYTAAGAQDNTFGSGGVVVADLSGPSDVYNGVAVASDGSIIAAGIGATGKYAVAARYHSDGTLDATTYVTLTNGASQTATGLAVATQPGGRVLVLGDWGGSAVGGFVQAYQLGTTTLSGSAVLTVTATGDHPPVAFDQAYSTGGATSLSIPAPGVLANDFDPDNNPLTAVLVAGPAYGTLALNANGSFTYTPGANFAGSDSFTFVANDGQLNSNVATVRITAAALGSIRGTLWDDVDGDGLRGAGDRALAVRTVFLDQNQNGLFDPGEIGTTTASDGTYLFSGLGPGTYYVAEVLPPGWSQTSSAGERAVTIGVTTPTVFDFNDLASPTDLNIGPYHKAGFTFTTDVNLSTIFTVFGSNDSAHYSGSPALNANPWPANISLTRDDGTPFTLTSIDLAEAWKSVIVPTVTFHGTKVGGSTVTQSFTLDNIFPGFQTFTFTGFDNVTAVTWYTHDTSDYHQFDNVKVQLATPLNVTGVDFGSIGPAGTAPAGSNDAYSTTEGTTRTVAAPGVLANDSDPNNDPLTAALAAGPAHGQLTFNANGSFSYVPAAGFYGTDSFTYQAFDGQNYSNLATVTLTVIAPPVASNDSYLAQQNTTLTVSGLGLSSGPVLRYLFDEAGSGTAPAVDSGAAPAANGTFVGAATRTGGTPQSASTGALDLTAGLGYVSAGSVTKLQNLSALTLTAWVNLRSAPANQSVLMSDNPNYFTSPAGNGGWELQIAQPFSNTNPLSAANFALQFTVYQDQGSYANGQGGSSTALSAAGRWVFLAVTFDANKALNFYVGDPANSVASAGSSTLAYGLAPNSAPFEIGATASGSAINRTPPAWLDDVRVYGSALSAAQLDGIRREDLGRGVLANDSDPQGRPLTAALVAGPAHGSLTLNANGTFSYTPAANFVGTDSFTYRASNGQATSNVATVALTVGAPPTAGNDAYSTAMNTALSVAAPGVLANDSDPGNKPLTAVLVAGPAHGTLTLDSNGSFTYTPATGFFGTDSFTYQASDGPLQSNVATVTLTVGAPPVAANDSYSTAENTALSVAAPGVLANDSDPNNAPLTAVLAAGPAHGTLALNANGSFTYTPAANYYGTDSFTYKASDGPFLSNVATVALTVLQPPTAGNDAYSTAMNTALSVATPGVLANDSDPQGRPLTAALVAGPAHGQLTLNANGSFTYTPATSFFGTDSFTYKASDGVATSNVATVALTVGAPPTAGNDAYSTAMNTALSVATPGVLANDSDPQGRPLTAVLVAGPAHGQLTLNANGSFTYTPATSFFGTDSFTYKASDGPLVSSPATVSLAVVDHPTAQNDSYAYIPGSPLTTTVAQTFVTMSSQPGDWVGQGQNYSFTPANSTITAHLLTDGPIVSGVEVDVTATGQNWTLDFAAPSPGWLVPGTYTGATRWPFQAAGVPGLDVSGDGRGSNTVAGQFTVTQAVYGTSGNLVAFAASFTQYGDGSSAALTGQVDFHFTNGLPNGVLANDSDANPAAPLTAVLVGGPGHGTVTLNGDGSFTYSPAAGFSGTDSFTYKANNGQFDSNVATVTLTADHPPTSQNDAYTLGTNSSLIAGVGGTFMTMNSQPGDFIGQGQPYDFTPANSTITATASGNSVQVHVTAPGHDWTLDFEAPNAGRLVPGVYTGATDFWSHTAGTPGLDVSGDGRGASGIAGAFTVSQAVYDTSGNLVSFAARFVQYNRGSTAALTGQVAFNSTRTLPGGVLANDSDPDSGTTLTAALVGNPAHGTLVINPDGSFAYFPAAGFTGTDSFTYRASDGSFGSSVATVTLTVAAPAANNDTGSTTANTALSVAAPGVLANDSDPNNDPLTAVLVAGPAHGTLALNSDGSYTYTPAANFVGTDTFTYQAGDGLATSGTATATITVASSSQATYSIWGPGATPQTADASDGNSIELGVRFTPSISGTITGLKFYKGPLNTGAHVADLWSSTGTLLATATFTNETASGWQQVSFSQPVAVTAGATYVASYHTNVGRYAVDRSYFATAYTSGPLQVPANGGVYSYGAAGTFPRNAYQGSNYWVDLVLSAQATQATPTITWANPASIVYGTALSSTQLDAAASVPGTFAYTPAAGTVLNAGNNQALSVTFTPTDTADYTTASATVSINVLPGTSTTYSLWSNNPTPQTADASDGNSVEVGVRFTPSISGTITALRFYKGPLNTGAHVADLWTSTGTLLATATFTNETASGWQQASLSQPVAVTAGTTYVASYHTNVGRYAVDRSYFSAAYTSGPLQVPANGGVYSYGAAGTFPRNAYQGSNYWVDLVLSTSPTGSARTATSGPAPTDPGGPAGATAFASMTATPVRSAAASAEIRGQLPGSSVAAGGGALGSSSLAIGALDLDGDDPASPAVPSVGERSSARGGLVRIRRRP